MNKSEVKAITADAAELALRLNRPELFAGERLGHVFAYESKRRWEQLAKSATKDCSFVYFIACGEFVKIGVANNVHDRLANLQTANPLKLRLVGSLPTKTPYDDEEMLHRIFAPFREKGEWFKITEEQILSVIWRSFFTSQINLCPVCGLQADLGCNDRGDLMCQKCSTWSMIKPSL